jgi:hypothetical protein
MPNTCDRCNATQETPMRYPSSDYGEPVMENEDGELVEVSRLCDPCHERYGDGDHTVCCPLCSRNVDESAMCLMPIMVHGEEIMCSRCAGDYTFVCGCCERTRSRDRYALEFNGDEICDNCSDNYATCEDCGHVMHVDNACWSDRNDAYYCGDCINSEEDEDGLFEYDYRPEPTFFGSPNGRPQRKTVYFGCELEVEVSNDYDRSERVDEVSGRLGDNVYLKKDGSLCHGFEIVTHPHTWDEIVKLWRDKWNNGVKGLRSHAPGTCGFHVHVSKAGLTPLQIQKIVVFINAPENHAFIQRIAQRDCTQWGQLKTNKVIGKCGFNNDRYEAVNLQNRNTIEFRIFRGNTRTDRILKNLQFVHACIAFTRDRSYRDLSASRFIAFVSDNRKTYPELHAFIGATQQATDNATETTED